MATFPPPALSKAHLGGHRGESSLLAESIDRFIDSRGGSAAILSVLQLTFDHLDSEGSERRQLLALPGLRRNLESHSPAHEHPEPVAAVIGGTKNTAAGRTRTVRHLQELIAALDRRVPQVQRAGEASIADAAAALRSDALKRIEELEGEARPAARPDDLR